MTVLENFCSTWNENFTGQRAKKQKSDWEHILFSIWKHHPDKNQDGFQINPEKVKNASKSTVYRVIELAEKAGLLKKTRNYLVGNFFRYYHKNHSLFNLVFRDSENKYGKWLNDNRNTDVFGTQFASKLSKKNLLKLANVDQVTSSKTTKSRGKKDKAKGLNYDLAKLHELSKTMLPHYYDVILKLNSTAAHNDLKIASTLRFDVDGLPTGRPYSYFSSTRNNKKKSKTSDDSIETRSDFLRRVGLYGYREIYDINAEVPRVNYLFHTGEWKPRSYDFYSEIIRDSRMAEIDGDVVSRGGSDLTPYNDSMKQLFMRIYFGKGSDWHSYNGYDKERRERVKDEDLYVFDKMLENGELVDFRIWKMLCNSTRKIVGASIGNLIFWYTFAIEAEVLLELQNRGMAVYNVYDGFYYNKCIGREIQRLVREKALFVYENFMKGIGLEKPRAVGLKL